MGSWDKHRNAKDFSRGERISMGLANFGREKVLRQNMDKHDYESELRSLRSAPGRETPARGNKGRHGASEKLSWADRRAADKALKKGKK